MPSVGWLTKDNMWLNLIIRRSHVHVQAMSKMRFWNFQLGVHQKPDTEQRGKKGNHLWLQEQPCVDLSQHQLWQWPQIPGYHHLCWPILDSKYLSSHKKDITETLLLLHRECADMLYHCMVQGLYRGEQDSADHQHSSEDCQVFTPLPFISADPETF